MHGLEGLVCLLQRVSFMHILSWNCQGLNNPPTRRALLNLVRQNGVDIGFVCETRTNCIEFLAH